MSQRMHGPEPLDDLDRLFARLQPLDPPRDLVARAMAEAKAREARRRLWLTIPGYVALLLAILAISYAFGRALATTGAGDLVSLAVLDPETFASAPGDFVLALVDSISWGLVAALFVVFVALGWCARSVAAAGAAR